MIIMLQKIWQRNLLTYSIYHQTCVVQIHPINAWMIREGAQPNPANNIAYSNYGKEKTCFTGLYSNHQCTILSNITKNYPSMKLA